MTQIFLIGLNVIFCWKLCFSAKAIDEYASLKTKAAESNKAADIDPRLEAIVERMLDKYENYI